MTTLTQPRRLNIDDFFAGFFAALALRGCTTITRRGPSFDEAVFHAYEHFRTRNSLPLAFQIRLHPIHGDSTMIRDGLASAARRDLIGLDNPTFQRIRLTLSHEEADSILANLPGGSGPYEELVDEFIANYQ